MSLAGNCGKRWKPGGDGLTDPDGPRIRETERLSPMPLDHLRLPSTGPLQRPRRVVVYGRHPQHWLTALAPEAAVWSGLADEVALARTSFELLRLGHRGGRQSIVMPLRERNITRCPRLYWGLWPSRRAVRVLSDKRAFARYVVAEGLTGLTPRHFERPGDVGFPVVVKRPGGSSGEGVALARDAAELARVLGEPRFRHREVVLQAHAGAGNDHVTHAVAVGGRIVWHRGYRYRLRPGTEIQTPDTVLGIEPVTESAATLAAFERLLLPLAYDGPLNIDTRRRADGQMMVLEVNPRMGGSLMRPEHVADLGACLSALIAHARPMWRRPVPPAAQ